MIPLRFPRGTVTADSGSRVLLFICSFYASHGYGPRHGDIMSAVGITRSTVHRHLERLAAAGLITWDPGKRGTIRPLVKITPTP